MKALPAPLLVVTDRHQAVLPLARVIEEVLAAGVRWIWLRDRDLERAARQDLVYSLRAETRACRAHLTVGGDVALAMQAGADGVQLAADADVAAVRQQLGAHAVIGVSAHRLAEVERAARGGADYVTLSPIFASASKPGYGPELGAQAIAEATGVGIPIVALGGVTATTAAECLEAGAAAVAVMGEVMRAADPAAVVRDILAVVSTLHVRRAK